MTESRSMLARRAALLGAFAAGEDGIALELGQWVPHRRLREAARPFMEELYEATHENVHLAVVDGADTVFLEKLTGRRSLRIISRVGGRLPAYCTATGKALLAYGTPPGLAAVLGGGPRRRTPRTIVVPRLLQQDLVRTRARGYAVPGRRPRSASPPSPPPSTGRGWARVPSPSPPSPSPAPRGGCGRTASRPWCARRRGR
ncbi:IclR family transcriptional regulator [Streptomyces sp. NPDC001902]